MTVSELCRAADLEILSLPNPGAEVTGGYSGDLLSWVMGRASEGDVWVTIMTNINIVAVALLSGVSAVLIAESAEIDPAVADKAAEQGINLLRSGESAFDAVLTLGRLMGKR